MHGRLFPKKNGFKYKIYYLMLPLSKLDKLPIAYNRFAPMSFYDRDHGACDGSNLEDWARGILNEYGITEVDGKITLMCMPRIFGYVFNPVSFLLCHDKQGNIRAVLCEVHNTFGERHTYLCAHPDQRVITPDDILKGEKLFHVSPFLDREGHYKFRFDFEGSKSAVWIDYYTPDNQKQLVTSLIGKTVLMDKQSLRHAFWRYPLVTIKAITLIHWQAFRLVSKGIKYIAKPKQKESKTSATENLTKI